MHWTLTRKDTSDHVDLPEDMYWQDEFDWQALAQATPQYSLGGAVIVQQGTMLAGRPITLSGEWIWLPRATLLTLAAWADVPELEMTLTAPDGRNLNVTFRTHDGALQASPVRWMHDEDDDAWYHAEIRLMTI